AISQSLHEAVAPIVGTTEVLSDECYTLAGNGYLDRLLVLAQVEIIPSCAATASAHGHRRAPSRRSHATSAPSSWLRLHRWTHPNAGPVPTEIATVTSPHVSAPHGTPHRARSRGTGRAGSACGPAQHR